MEMSSLCFYLFFYILSSCGTGAIPVIRDPLGNITINYCTILKKVIMSDAYYESTPGQQITLKLLGLGNTLVKDNWPLINFDSTTWTLYVVPTSKSVTQTARVPGEYHYTIRVENLVTKSIVDDNFWLKLVGEQDVNQRNFGFELENRVLTSQTKNVINLYTYVEKIFNFFKTPTTDKVIQVYDHEFLSDGRLNVYFQNCTIRESPCDDGNTERILRELKTPEFAKSLQPQFNLTSVSENRLTPCNHINNGPSLTQEFIMALYVIHTMSSLLFVDPYPGMYRWYLPRLFSNKETQTFFFRNSLATTDPNSQWDVIDAPKSYWTHIINDFTLETNLLLITIVDDTYTSPTNPYSTGTANYTVVMLTIFAIDVRNKVSTTSPSFFMVLPAVRYSYYSIRFNFTAFQTSNADIFVLNTQIFLNATIRALGESYRTLVFLNNFHLDGSSLSGTAVWSVKVYPGCNFTMIRQVQTMMFGSTTQKQVTSNFKQSLSTSFILTSVEEYYRGKCKIEPPFVQREISDLTIPFCGIFKYQIPDDVFFDNQDGGTRNLTLKLLVRGEDIPALSWININSNQMIYAVLPATMATTSFQRQQTYQVMATDTSGQSTVADLKLNIIGSPNKVAFEISVKGNYTPGASKVSVGYFLGLKVSTWLNNDGSTFQLQENVITSQQQNFLTFSTCEWRYDPCDAVKISAYKKKFFDSAGLAIPNFITTLAPEFQSVTLSPSTSGPCQDDKKPTDGDSWGPFTISSCTTFDLQVPENTFSDPEQGNTRSLDLNLSGTPPALIDLPNWIHFDATSQRLTIIPYSMLTVNQYILTLTAFDINKRSASQNIQVNLEKIGANVPVPSHTIEMTFKVTSGMNKFVAIYSKLRDKLKTYLGESDDVIQYMSMTSGSLIFSVKWTHCKISTTSCERDRINNMKTKLIFNNKPSPSLAYSLRSDFTVESVKLTFSGICVTETEAPSVKNLIPDQTIYYCNFLRYQIPADTFQDKIDGNTRKLTLSASYKKATLPDWMAFDASSQEILTILQSKKPAAENTTIVEITATTKRGLSVTTNVKFTLGDTPKQREMYLRVITKIYKLDFTSSNKVSLLDTYIDFLQKIETAFKFSKARVHYYEVSTKSSGGQNYIIAQIISCNYYNCTLEEIPKLTAPLTGKFDATVFTPDYQTPRPVVSGQSKCKVEKKPPKVIQNIPTFTVSRCRTFRHEVTAEVIEYDDGLDKLKFLVKAINGNPINPLTSWIYMDGVFISGVITHSVIEKVPSSKRYNVTVSVTDPDDNEVVTWAIITITGKVPQLYYQYEMQLADKVIRSANLSPSLSRKSGLTDLINAYFKYDIVNIVSYQDMTNNRFNLIWSVCPLPNKCTDTGLTSSESEMMKANQPVEAFINTLKSQFDLEVLKKKISQFCSGTLNPPTATIDPLTINLPYCGGFEYVVPEDLFDDQEDGNTRNLKLYFETSRDAPAAITYPWLEFDESKQQIRGMPLYITAKLLVESKNVFFLRAQDKSGLDKSILVHLKFELTQDPKFFFIVTVADTFQSITVDYRFQFMDKLAKFRGDPDRKSIGFHSTNRDNKGVVVEYFNCTLKYSPCDLYKFRKMKAEFSDDNDFPTPAFRDVMKPVFIIDYVHTSMLSPCGDPYPPTLIIRPPVLNITMCGIFQYLIPAETFYDTEQGNTRNLNLAIKPKTGSNFQLTSFIQFSSVTQSFQVIPSAFTMSTQNSHTFLLTLTATDNTNLAAVTEIEMNIFGPYSILEECQIQITLTRLSNSQTAQQTNVEVMRYIIDKLSTYFQLSTQQEIGVVKFTQISQTTVMFAWSYCSAIYRTAAYATNSAHLVVDFYNLQTRILMKLFDNQRKLNSNFQSIFQNDYKVDKVETRFTGRCRDLPPIATPDHETITIRLQYGGYALHTYSDNYFYDYEDGGSFSLSLSFLTSANTTVLIDHWINIDYKLHTIFAIVVDTVRLSTASSAIFRYHFLATDTAGQSAMIVVNVKKYTIIYSFAPFNITYALEYNKESGMIYSRQARYLIDVITNYFESVTSYVFVLVRWYLKTSGYSQYRVFTFSIANHGCSSKVLARIKTAYSQGILDQSLKSSVSELFTLHRVYNETTCSNDPDPPSPVDPLPSFTITYCNVWIYNLPRTLFHDTEDGETIGLKLNLLNSDESSISTSSWLQLNTVTRQLYAVAIQSTVKTQSSFDYRIQATNSRIISRDVAFTASVKNEPFTVDCRMVMNFRYKYMTSNIVDLDIIRTFISMISKYYGDNTENMVKILDFVRFDTSYNVTWSNCSFTFPTMQQASNGLTEAQRSQITTIFSQVVTSTATTTSADVINPKFQMSMSSYFVINSIFVSYDCIEEPPVPSKQTYLVFPKFCSLFNESVPQTAFYDKRDGHTRNLKLKLLDVNEKEVTIDSWVQIDERQNIYGVVTDKVKDESPSGGYQYYVQATDSSGRSAKVEYVLKVASPKKNHHVYFRTGFENKFGYLTFTARILYSFVDRLSKYIDPNDQIGRLYVKEFQYPSVVLWTHCSLETCTPQSVQAILSKLRTSTGVITTEFLFHMSPNFVPNQQRVEMKDSSCASSNISIIVYPPTPNTTLPHCGFFRFRVPEYVFGDLIQRNTRTFFLNFLNNDNSAVSANSWIRFNGAQQFVYGLNILSKTPQTSTYRIQAVMPESGYSTYSNAVFRVEGHRNIQSMLEKLCWIKFHMSVYYNPRFDDVSIIEMFMNVLASYLKSPVNQIQIYGYERNATGYPFRFTVTWTNCSMTSIFQKDPYAETYYTSLKTILQQFLSVTKDGKYSTMTSQVKSFFQQNSLLLLTSITTANCSRPHTRPPKPKGPLTIEVKCGIFQERVPEDTFSDDEDGDTRQLQLKILQADSTELPSNAWLTINDEQFIFVMIDNQTILTSTTFEYRFLLQATDTHGSSSQVALIVKVPSKPFQASILKLSLFVMSSMDFEYDIIPKLVITNALINVLVNNLKADASKVNLYISIFLKIGNSMQIQLENCDSCDSLVNFRIDQLPNNKDQVIAELPPELSVVAMTTSVVGSVDRYCGIAASPNLVNVEIPYCGNLTFKYDLRIAELPEIVDYLIEFPSPPEPSLLQNSWIWFVNYTFEFFPSEAQWETPNFSEKHAYSVLYKDGAPTGRKVQNEFSLKEGAGKNTDTVDYVIVLQESGSRSQFFDNYYISMVMNAVVNLLGTGRGIHFVSFRILQNSPFRFEVKWLNCTFPTDCTNSDIQKVNDILFNTPNIGSVALTSYLPPGVKLIGLENKCKNTPPKSGSPLFLSVPVCGKFQYKLPVNITSDAEDGTNLKVSMTLYNGNALPRFSWMLYDPSTRIIYAFPVEGIVLLQQRRRFLLWFEDSGGLKSNLTVNVDVETNENVYYEMNIGFRSLLDKSKPYIDIVCRMLELISQYQLRRIDLKDYRVMSFGAIGQASSETYLLKYAVCSINQTICEKDKNDVLQLESELKTSDDQFQQGFSKFVDKYFVGTTIQREPKDLSIDEKPKLLRTIDTIDLTKCEGKRVNITNSIFRDEDATLKYCFKFQNGSLVPKTFWIQTDGFYIYVYPWTNVTKGVYSFLLCAEDRCGGQLTTPVKVNIRSVYDVKVGGELLFGYTWTTAVRKNVSETRPDVFYVDQMKEAAVTLSRSSSNQIKILSYELNKDQIKVRYGDCSITYLPCDKAKVKDLISTVFLDGENTISSEAREAFQPVGEVVEMTGTRQGTCNIDGKSPDCDNRLEVNATYCSILKFELPADLCKEKNRDLTFGLFTSNGSYLSNDAWLEFDSGKNMITGYPLYVPEQTTVPSTERYLLRVRNEEKQSTFVNVVVNLTGGTPNLDYRMSISGIYTGTDTRSQVGNRYCIAKKLSELFDRDDISNIRYAENKNRISFDWSFCKQRRVPCECSVIRLSQNRLENRDEVSSKLSECSVSFQQTSYTLYGECEKTKAPEPRDKLQTTVVNLGQTYERQLEPDMFSDAENGEIVNMTMYVTDMNDERLKDAVWMRVDDGKLCGLVAFKEFIRRGYTEETTKTYKMVAKDSCGKNASSAYNMIFKNNFPTLYYRIIFLLDMPYGDQNCSTVNGILNTVSDYSEVPKTDIYVRDFRNSSNGTYMEWGVRKFTGKDCDNEEYELYREKFIKDGKGNEMFLERMTKDGYPVSEVSDRVEIECGDPFPWWILILILALLLLFLLLWCLWCLIPRCCSACCSRTCPGCTQCCTRGGKYSSLRNPDKLEEDLDDDERDGALPPYSGPVEGDDDSVPIPVVLPPLYPPDAGQNLIDKDVIDGGGFPDEYRTESYKDKRPTTWSYIGNERHDSDDPHIGNGPQIEKGPYVIDRPVNTQDDNYHYHRNVVDKSKSNRYFVDYSNDRAPNRTRYIGQRSKQYMVDDGDNDYFYYYDGDSRYGNRDERYYSYDDRFHGTRYAPSTAEIKQPLAIRIRRSDLREYIRKKGRRLDGDFYLTEQDLSELMLANSRRKVYRSEGHNGNRISTDSRLADALVDRKVVRRYKTDKNYRKKPRHRRHSVASLTEYQPRIKEGNHTHSNVHWRITNATSSSSPFDSTTSATYTTSGGPSERLYVVDSNYFKGQDYTSNSSLDDNMVITPIQSIPMYRKSNRNKTAYISRSRGDHSGGQYGSSRHRNTSGHSRRTVSYRNAGYNYDESSV